MSYLIAKKNLLSPDLRQLISQITGFSESSEEFNTCENNAWTTIMHYNCPFVDKSSVKAKLSGFAEKFRIHAHSFPQKANNMEMLLHHYLEINCYEEDVRWGLLHILLSLSRRPTEAKVDDLPIEFPLYRPETEEETFDWVAYLKEGLPDYRLPSSDNSSEEESEEEDELVGLKSSKEAIYQASREIRKQRQCNLSGNLTDTTHFPPPYHSSHSHAASGSTLVQSSHPTDLRSGDETVSETVRENVDTMSREQLKIALIFKESNRRLSSQWWTDQLLREIPPSTMPVATACFAWEKEMSVKGGLIVGETRILSEAKAIKELLWALAHPQDYYIIKKCEQGYKPREMISISSTNPADFFNAISEICTYLSMIESFQAFIKTIDSSPFAGSCSLSTVPKTFVAYATALKDIMKAFSSFLEVVEAYVTKQDNIYMISYLMIEVRPWLKHLKFLHNVHTKAISKDWKNQENWICAARLLSVFYNTLEHTNGWGKLELTIIFLKSFQPYVDILETWLVHSKCTDHQDEFLITRPSKPLSEGKLIVRDYQSQLLNINIQKTQFLDNFIYYSMRACSSVDFQIVLQTNSFDNQTLSDECSPFYLEFLNSLVSEIQEEGNCTQNSLQPHQNLFVEKFESLLEQVAENEPNTVEENDRQLCAPYCWNGANFIASDAFSCAFMSVTQAIDRVELFNKSNCSKIAGLLKTLEKIDVDSIEITRLLKKHFSLVIMERMQPKGFAKDTLLNDYRLLEHLTILKNVYLFLGGVTMSVFSKSMFSKAVVNGLKTISWTNELRELLYKDFPTNYTNFAVTLPYDKLHFKNLLNISEASYPDFISFSKHISINYMLEPPLNLVVTGDSIEKYNELFQFIVKIKWALWCLSNLSFKDLSKSSSGTLSARLISLRLFLLHNVSTLEKYFISINSEDFDGEISHVCSIARDIHVIAMAHDKILNQRRKHCFLIGAPKILECIQNILKFCQLFSSLWKLSLQVLYELKVNSELCNFELKYQDCVNELANGLLLLGKDHIFKNNVNFSYLCDELFNNMPGDWE